MKKGHFRLTCVAQKRCCLSSLLLPSQRIGPKTKTTRGLRLRHFPALNTGHPIYFVLNSDWFVDLSEFVTIGQGYCYYGFR